MHRIQSWEQHVTMDPLAKKDLGMQNCITIITSNQILYFLTFSKAGCHDNMSTITDSSYNLLFSSHL